MVRVADIEGLLKRYVDENDLERADALYLLSNAWHRDLVTKTLRARYGRAGAISSVIEDLKTIGLSDELSSTYTEDTRERVDTIISEFFKHNFSSLVINFAKEKVKTLSRVARAILYLICMFKTSEIIGTREKIELKKLHKVIFQVTLDDSDIEKALDELVSSHFMYYYSYPSNPKLSPYFDVLISNLYYILPKVEIRVSWPEEHE